MDHVRTMPALRFAVLCDSDRIERWQLDAIEALARRRIADCIAILLPKSRADETRISRPRLSRYTLYNLYFRRVARRCDAKQLVFVRNAFPNAEVIEIDTQRLPKGRTGIGEESLAAIAALDLDFAVRFGFGILSGPVLTLPRFGVWSFHHGDPAHFRGQPPGVWEIIHKAPATGAMVQQLTESLDAGPVLAIGKFPTVASSYTRQLDLLLSGSVPLLASVAMYCGRHGKLPALTIAALGPIYRKPTTGPALVLFARMLLSKIAGFGLAMTRSQHWAIFASEKRIGELLADGMGQRLDKAFPHRHELAEQSGMFNADPFARSKTDGGLQLMFERLETKSGKGHIASCAMNPSGQFTKPERFLTTAGHLSYPFLMEEGDSLSIIPESVEDGVLKRYELSRGGDRVLNEQKIGAAVLDPTVFRHDGKYWMFYCGDERNTTLCLRIAEHFDGPWREHPCNPVKIDVTSARPAGPVMSLDDDLVRPGQTCVPHYGQGIVFNKIMKLDEYTYVEEPIASLLPAATGRYRHGVHTICAAENWLVLDHARRRFSLYEAWRLIRAALSRLLVVQRA